MSDTRTRRRAAAVTATALLLASAACGAVPTDSAPPTVAPTTTSSSPRDPAALAAQARDALETTDGFTARGRIRFEADAASVILQVGQRTGHAELSGPYGEFSLDWDDDRGGLFVTAPASFWRAFGEPTSLTGRPVAVPPTDPLARLLRYVSIEAAVPVLFQSLAGSPAEATPAGPGQLDIAYDVGSSHLLVRVDDATPLRFRSTGTDLEITGLGTTPVATIPADGGVPLPTV